MHNSAPVREVLASRGINCNTLCLVCKNQSESINHLLRECPFAIRFWLKLRNPHIISPSHSQSLGDWLYDNCHSKQVHHSSISWSVVFPFAVWFLWKHRNKVVFENSPLNMNLHGLCLSQAIEFSFCVGKLRMVNQRFLIQVSWSKPPEGWYKLNTDGASYGNPGKAGGGGLIRDCSRRWIEGFARSIGFTTSITAEFWALRDGLKLALSEGIQNLIVELDARVVIDLINSNVDTVKPYSPLLYDCRCLLRRFPQAQVKHVYREGNRCADALANWGCLG
ncbi:hypothetical protein SO802_013695 [Lithocarpus litseifolius]|uniref:RNase H type-1 domain-containing protein n=1 Tax=Lithocarpus litseifolius TaxID=425828 RepID=A0AAW2D782_9ROSI